METGKEEVRRAVASSESRSQQWPDGNFSSVLPCTS